MISADFKAGCLKIDLPNHCKENGVLTALTNIFDKYRSAIILKIAIALANGPFVKVAIFGF